jgi:drug/metabolite transporter (DMT)-like permease
VLFTVIAAAGQVVRNAAQRGLTASLGTVGATHVRFLFGFPFAIVFLGIVMTATGAPLPSPSLTFWPWVGLGAATQIVATAMMLAAMERRSFVVTTAYLKTEPLQVAVFGLLFLGDPVTLPLGIGIVVATLGVLVMSVRSRGGAAGPGAVLFGLAAAALFALSAVGYRGAILNARGAGFVMSATFTLAVGLALQTAALSLYLWLRDRAVLVAIMRAWKPSLFAGFVGAAASQFWFLAFALATAASVRTLSLIEVLFAQAMSHIVFKQKATLRELIGIALIVVGVVVLVSQY